MPAVDVPISISASGYKAATLAAIASSTSVRTSGYDKVKRLSQYIGLLMPLAHTNGFAGRKNTAFIERSAAAISLSVAVEVTWFIFLLSSFFTFLVMHALAMPTELGSHELLDYCIKCDGWILRASDGATYDEL